MEPWTLSPCVRPLGQRGLFVHTRCHLYLVLRSRSIEIVFWAKTQQLGFLKNHFCATLRHLRSTWDVRTKVFSKMDETVLWPKLLRSFLSIFEKAHQQINVEFGPPHQLMRLVKSFSSIYSNLSYLALSVLRQIDFLCVHFWWPIQLKYTDRLSVFHGPPFALQCCSV